jgi:hypothetical protein
MNRLRRVAFAAVLAASVAGCQSPTAPDETIGVDEFIDVSVSPDPVVADTSVDNKTYTVLVNDVTETRVYDWKASFAITARLNDMAGDDDLDLTFPVDLTAATFEVDQATGGIRNPPTGGEIEQHLATIVQSTGNRFAGISTSQTLTVDLWYDLPHLRKEGIIIATLSFKDADGLTFTRAYEVRIAP